MLGHRLTAPLLLTTAVACSAFVPVIASAQAPASISVDSALTYNVTTLAIDGTASCTGGGTAGVTVVNASLAQMFQGGVGGPIAIQLNGPVMVNCDGTQQSWTGQLVAPGRALPNDSGGTLTVTLAQGSNTIATTGPQSVHITT
ncbi:hypothetical protein [Nocardia sp. NPDC020380]|uniref:hypothetical protein n=1 Tax=Nocardia sp. NPDC020380 TaxID=3364309 RepID=UPI00379351D0